MDKLKEISPNKLMLCGGKRCCPTIELIDKNTVKINDDFGGSVELQIDQAALISEALFQLKK